MRVLSKPTLVTFWKSRKVDSRQAEQDLSAWYTAAKHAEKWKDFAALKQTFSSADQVGSCVVFDIGNNRYRLIGRVNYQAGMLLILKVMDHKEYDKGLWEDQCGCRKPPPKSQPKKTMPNGRNNGR